MKKSRAVNYSKLPTEQQNPRSRRIDRLSVPQVLNIINREDQSVPKAVSKVKGPVAKGVGLIVKSLQKGGRLFFAGAGTSGRLAVIEAAECPPTFGTSPQLVQAIIAGGKSAVFRSKEGAEDRRDEGYRVFLKKVRPSDTIVGIAASGVTPFVAGALAAARSKGAKTILVACNAASPMKRQVDCLIAPKVGPEVITGSTRLKAGTATKLVLNMLTVASMIRVGKVYQNWMVDVQPKSRKLEARALRLIERLGRVSPEKAQDYFRESRRNVKVGILMARKRWDYPTAVQKLKRSSGFLEKALS